MLPNNKHTSNKYTSSQQLMELFPKFVTYRYRKFEENKNHPEFHQITMDLELDINNTEVAEAIQTDTSQITQ